MVRFSALRRASDDFQRVAVWKLGKGLGRKRLIPIGDRANVMLAGKIAALFAPTERLDGHAQVGAEVDGVHDMPAIHGVAML